MNLLYIIAVLILITVLLFLALFKVKLAKFWVYVKWGIYIGRGILILLVIYFISVFNTTLSFQKISNIMFDWKIESIPKVSYVELEKLPFMIWEDSNIAVIEKSWIGEFHFLNADKKEVLLSNAQILTDILTKNNIRRVYIDNDFYKFYIEHTYLVFILSKDWNIQQKDWKTWWSKTHNQILNNKWAFYEDCTRNTCPEIINK